MRKLYDLIPCLKEKLDENNYKQRFHALLYLEEISQLVNIRSYDMPRAHFRKHFDFLVLEVPGLAEKRPSLICGDTIIISNPCSVSDEGGIIFIYIYKEWPNRSSDFFSYFAHTVDTPHSLTLLTPVHAQVVLVKNG